MGKVKLVAAVGVVEVAEGVEAADVVERARLRAVA